MRTDAKKNYDLLIEVARDVVAEHWIVDEIRPARIHANVPEAAAGHAEAFAGADIRDEGGTRRSMGAWLLRAHRA